MLPDYGGGCAADVEIRIARQECDIGEVGTERRVCEGFDDGIAKVSGGAGDA
jgi:hypothetical protein